MKRLIVNQLEYTDSAQIAKSVVLQRSISLPVQTCLSHEWGEFMRLLHNAWRQSTDLANWAGQTLARHDTVRLPSMEKLPPYQAIDLYALAFGRAQERAGRELWGCAACKKKWFPSRTQNGRAPDHKKGKETCAGSGRETTRMPRSVLPRVEGQLKGEDWQGAKACAAQLLHKVEKKYKKDRFSRIWLREKRVPEFNYPYPFPVHSDAWGGWFGEQQEPVVSLQLPGGRVTARLRGGNEFRPQLRVFRQIVDTEIKQQSLEICSQPSHGKNGRTGRHRFAGGDQRRTFRVMLRIAYPLELYRAAGEGTAVLTTGVDPFLSLQIAGKSFASVWHCPWVKNWTIEHRLFLDAFADDLKFEKRWPGSKRHALNRYQERRVEKHGRRMKSWRQETVHQIVAMLARNKVRELLYDDRDHDFAEEFPWHQFAQNLADKCAEFGLVFRHPASGGALNESTGTARGE